MEEELIRPTEKVVNMSVAPGELHATHTAEVQLTQADGSRVEAKTPEGTRVATPSQAGLASQAGPSAGTPRSASYAGAVKTAPVDWHLEFSLGGQPVSLEDTIYGAVHKSKGGPASLGGVHGAAVVLRFKKVDGPATSELSV
jgi:E3 ubiquitin-protein ligase TRIP12